MTVSIPFIDLQAQRARLGTRIDDAVQRVLSHGAFILGAEVLELERQLAQFLSVRHAITCASGTDALQMPLMAWGIGPGDAVFTPSFTFAATAEVIALVGATPIMIDAAPDTFNLDPLDLERAIDEVKAEGELTPRAIIAVDLFGQPADYQRISEIARRRQLKLIADSAQSLGATIDGRHPVSWADAAATSFYPAKPLGCYGDGGAIFTDDDDLADLLLSIRNHGQGRDRYEHVRIGLNSRLDTIQAAILLAKLEVFPEEIELRNEVAEKYETALGDVVQTPLAPDGVQSVWAQYTIKSNKRDALSATLRDKGIPTAIHYPRPLHTQTAYKNFPRRSGNKLPVSEMLATQVLSLPMHAYLKAEDQVRVIEAVIRDSGR